MYSKKSQENGSCAPFEPLFLKSCLPIPILYPVVSHNSVLQPFAKVVECHGEDLRDVETKLHLKL